MHPTTDVCPVHAMHNAPQVHRARAAAMCIVQFTSFCELVRSIHIFIVFRRYAVLARRGDVFGEAVWGQLLTVDGEPAATDNNPSNNEDYTSLLPYKDTVYMVAQFESPSPSSSYFAKAKQGKDGEIEIESAEIMDWTEYGGLANPCAGSTSPWKSHLGSGAPCFKFTTMLHICMQSWCKARKYGVACFAVCHTQSL